MQQMIFIADLIACSTCFGAPLCPSSGARECYTSCCCLSYLVLWFSSCRYGVELRGSSPQTGHTTLSSTPYRQLEESQAPNTTGSNHLYNTLELLMMGMMVPETCWASNKICNKNHLLHLVGILFPHVTSVYVNLIVLYESILCYIMLYDRLTWVRVQMVMLWDRVIYGHLMFSCYNISDRVSFLFHGMRLNVCQCNRIQYSTESRTWNMQKPESFMQRKV